MAERMTFLLKRLTIQHPETSAVQGSIIATWILAFVAVALRLVARRFSKARLWYDDFMIIPALFCTLGLLFNGTVGLVDNGLGQNFKLLTTQTLRNLSKGAYIVENLWIVAITFIKFSILLLYLRLFANLKVARWTIQALMGVVSLWGILVVSTNPEHFFDQVANNIGQFFLTVFRCNPISRGWEVPTVPGTCITNGAHLLIGSTVPHIVTDVAILAIPIPVVWGLQMQLSQRLILCCIFSLGGFVTIISGVRLYYLIALSRSPDQNLTQNLVNIAIWTSVEVNIAIVCAHLLPACLPCLRPIGSFIADKLEALRKRKTRPRRGKELLIDMLPRRKQRRATSSTLPVSRNLELDVAGPNPFPSEIEAKERPLPEMNECCLQEMNSNDVVAVELKAHKGHFSAMELEA